MELYLQILQSGWGFILLMLGTDLMHKHISGEDMPDWYQIAGALLTVVFLISTFVYIQMRIWL